WEQLFDELHGAELSPGKGATGGALDLHVEETPIEVDVVGHEHADVERAEQLIADLGEGRRTTDHLGGDVRQATDPGLNDAPGIDERVDERGCNAIFHLDDRDLG